MSNDLETKVRNALEKGKPLFEAIIADLEREATLIKERDLDPRKFAEEPRVQEARSGAADALEQLANFAKSLDSLVKSYAQDIEKRVDVDSIKEQIASAPAAGRSLIEDHNGHAAADRIKVAGEDARAKMASRADEGKETLQAAAQKGYEDAQALAQQARDEAQAAAQKAKEDAQAAAHQAKVDAQEAAHKAKEEAQAAAHKAKESTKEMMAALGWLAAAGTVIYVVFMDEKRRRQAKSVAKAAGNGLLVVANSASKKS